MTITISVKNSYGNTLYYPECDVSYIFSRIAGTKTLTQETIKLIKALGYAINVKHDLKGCRVNIKRQRIYDSIPLTYLT